MRQVQKVAREKFEQGDDDVIDEEFKDTPEMKALTERKNKQ